MPKRRTLVKLALLRGLTVLVFPLIAIAKLEQLFSHGECWFSGIGEFLGLFPGRIGSYIRLAYYRATIEQCASDVVFGIGTRVNHRTARIGRRVVFGAHCSIGTVTIGDNCLIGSRVHLLSGRRQHHFLDLGENINDHTPTFERVEIGVNAWIGDCAVVMARIGARCVVAAGSVVFRPVPDQHVAMGNPARFFSRKFSTPVPTESRISEEYAS
jgi:acetyltransferase-like isoleucine patch superfamily enzyme